MELRTNARQYTSCNIWKPVPPVILHQNEHHFANPHHVAIFYFEKMAYKGVFWQCAMAEFVVKGEIPASDINALLNRACGVPA
jgi:hypothetical protein